MRYQECKTCGHIFVEDDTNPAIHYSNPSDHCDRCKMIEMLQMVHGYKTLKGTTIRKELNQKWNRDKQEMKLGES